jgi:ferredoxin
MANDRRQVMVLRKIITIDEEKCNGCGNCITGCAEGALQLVNGKAKLVKENFCDGFGDCIGTCPTGALKVEERESEAFDFDKTYEHVKTTRGTECADNMAESFKRHLGEDQGKTDNPASEKKSPCSSGGCPGTRARMLSRENNSKMQSSSVSQKTNASLGTVNVNEEIPQVIKPEITQWPVQLHLVPPKAPFFENRELAVLSTCAPVNCPDVHWRFIRGRSVVTACPKLDRTQGYAEKLAAVFANNNIPRVVILRMEVPCCGGLTQIVRQALEMSGRGDDLVIDEVWIRLTGEIFKTERING